MEIETTTKRTVVIVEDVKPHEMIIELRLQQDEEEDGFRFLGDANVQFGDDTFQATPERIERAADAIRKYREQKLRDHSRCCSLHGYQAASVWRCEVCAKEEEDREARAKQNGNSALPVATPPSPLAVVEDERNIF